MCSVILDCYRMVNFMGTVVLRKCLAKSIHEKMVNLLHGGYKE